MEPEVRFGIVNGSMPGILLPVELSRLASIRLIRRSAFVLGMARGVHFLGIQSDRRGSARGRVCDRVVPTDRHLAASIISPQGPLAGEPSADP
jgi:hypothetical protein